MAAAARDGALRNRPRRQLLQPQRYVAASTISHSTPKMTAVTTIIGITFSSIMGGPPVASDNENESCASAFPMLDDESVMDAAHKRDCIATGDDTQPPHARGSRRLLRASPDSRHFDRF